MRGQELSLAGGQLAWVGGGEKVCGTGEQRVRGLRAERAGAKGSLEPGWKELSPNPLLSWAFTLHGAGNKKTVVSLSSFSFFFFFLGIKEGFILVKSTPTSPPFRAYYFVF